MEIFKNKVSLENRETFQKFLRGYRYCTSGLSFSSLYMWRDINDFTWDILGDYMVIGGKSHLELEDNVVLPFMEMPLTCTGTYEPMKLRETIYEAKSIFEREGRPFSMRLIPFPLIEVLEKACPGELRFTVDRPNFDYLYEKNDMIELKGRLLHKKKNHLNYFLKNYEYEYKTLTSAMADEAMEFIDEFNKRKEIPPHEMELLKMEETAMRDVFNNLEDAGYIGGAVYIDGKIEALSVGGIMNNNTVGVHIEKGNVAFRGIYQVINMEFCKHLISSIKYVNREEDMGLPGLRKAKLSYKPCKMVEKYIATFRPGICRWK